MLLHAFIPASRANGPGLRSVVFFQGCTLACQNCFNPDSHPFTGAAVTVLAVAERVVQAHKEHGTEGVTFSGGEAMQQAPALLELIGTLRQHELRPVQRLRRMGACPGTILDVGLRLL
jgi:anaerobic ribonucleoside-triphosphate reductase activating protein